tara:strand:- start:75 stop:365 length:291 start_codon:yes stop_codon:yes gene_type:complete
MIYLVNCDKLKFFKTFDSLNSVIDYLKERNKTDFDGGVFGLFGRGQKEVWNGEESEWIDDAYYIDSAVLCPKGKPNEYFTFFIRCMDSEGNLIELD